MAGGPDVVGGNRLGGAPDLPPGAAWPRCKGRNLSFLAQVRLADVAAAVPGALPSSGVLAVFADVHPNADGVPPIEEAYGHVGKDTCVIVRRWRGTLAPRPTPKHVETLKRRPVQLRKTLTIPDDYLAETRYGLKGETNYFDLAGEAAVGRLGHRRNPNYDAVHQLLGWPKAVQDTPLYGCEGTRKQPDYRLLLQLDFDEHLDFAIGDGGVFWITGKASDLRAGRFSKLCAEMQED